MESAATAFALTTPVHDRTNDAAEYFRVKLYPKDAIIYGPDDAADRAFILRSGRVFLRRRPADVAGAGADRTHAILRPGDLFGDITPGSAGTMGEVAVARTEVEVWAIDGGELSRLVEARPILALDIISGLGMRVRSMQRMLNTVTFKEVPARLAEVLLALRETHGERCSHGGETDLRGITQQDLADLVGASRSFVSTLINEMKRDGLLSSIGRVLCVRNPGELERLAAKDRV